MPTFLYYKNIQFGGLFFPRGSTFHHKNRRLADKCYRESSVEYFITAFLRTVFIMAPIIQRMVFVRVSQHHHPCWRLPSNNPAGRCTAPGRDHHRTLTGRAEPWRRERFRDRKQERGPTGPLLVSFEVEMRSGKRSLPSQ